MITIDKGTLQTLLSNSSAGVALFTVEQDLAYSETLRKIYLDEFTSGMLCGGVQVFGRGGVDYIVVYADDIRITDCHYDQRELESMSVGELISLAESASLFYTEDTPKSKIMEDMMQVTHENYFDNLYAENGYRFLEYDDAITGPHQGDLIKVKFVGDVQYSNEFLTRIFYKTPISGSIQFSHNGKVLLDFHYSDYMDDEYQWNRKEFIDSLKKYLSNTQYSDIFFNLLEDKLPAELEHEI